MPQFHQPSFLAYTQDLNEQPRNGPEMTLSEVRNPAVVGMAVAREHPEGNVLIGLLLYAPGTPNPHTVSVEQELEHHGRVIGRMSSLKVKVFISYFVISRCPLHRL